MLRWQTTISLNQQSASYTSIYSWKQETLDPGLLYLRKIWFHSDPIAGWPAPQCCGVLDTSALSSLEAARCKGLCSVQNTSENGVLWVEGQNPSPFRGSFSAPFYCWQVPKVECIYAWITCLNQVCCPLKGGMQCTLYGSSLLALVLQYLRGAVHGKGLHTLCLAIT